MTMYLYKTFKSYKNFCVKQGFSVFISLAAFMLFFTLIGCNRVSASTLQISISDSAKIIPLTALNETAKNATITAPQTSPYLYFGLPEEYSLTLPFPVSALELKLTTVGDTQGSNGECLISLLYDSDFTSPNTLKKELSVRKTVQGLIPSNADFTVSFAFEPLGAAQNETIRGFAVYSSIPLSVKTATIVPATFGWSKREGQNWSGFSSEGGTIPSELFADAGENPAQTDFYAVSALLSPTEQTKHSSSALKVYLRDNPSDMGASSKQSRVSLSVADKNINIRRTPTQCMVNLDAILFSKDINLVSLEQNAHMVEGLVIELGVNKPVGDKKYIPIVADPGLMLDWPQSEWRRQDFELFSWEQFPSVLFFDFADYAIQDDFLKRLAFYVEKNGYTGRLWTEQQLAGLHAFNAQDYRAESLAAFFSQAHEEQFTLNESELLLRDILLENGIIVHNAAQAPLYSPGEGAIVSISRESEDYLRTVLLTHEALHGIYFVQSDFRDKVLSLYNQIDQKSLQFLIRYFEVTPSLNYDLSDTYLLKNEFMAYMLQQSPYAAKSYFADTLSNRYYIGQAEPELCEYIRKTKATAFEQASLSLSNFLYERWGLFGGRVTLVTMD